jgi:predicted nucleic acid-binding protein
VTDAALRRFLTPFGTLPITEAQVWRAARIEADLALAGETIGSADTWIAAAALETGLPVLTQNTRHFTRIPGVQVIGYSILP